ncbi:hypothetical protein SD074_05960 [Prolixibacter sp. SD074]|nr:hypothetical protein SD074_05960 [Prolixibacter sp. SD074]
MAGRFILPVSSDVAIIYAQGHEYGNGSHNEHSYHWLNSSVSEALDIF